MLCGHGWGRTSALPRFRRVLYQLSYMALRAPASEPIRYGAARATGRSTRRLAHYAPSWSSHAGLPSAVFQAPLTTAVPHMAHVSVSTDVSMLPSLAFQRCVASHLALGGYLAAGN